MKDVNSISPVDRRPLYLKAIDVIIEMVESGKMPVGSQLPPEGELAEMLGISRSTLREALGHLESFGVVTRQQGRGTFVTASQGLEFLGGLERLETFRSLANRAKKEHGVICREVSSFSPTKELQQSMNIGPDSKPIRVEIVESIDDIPSMYLVDYVIADEQQEQEMLSYSGSILTYLIEDNDPPLTYAKAKIYSVGATPDVAEKLSIEEGRPVLYMNENGFNAVGDMVSLTNIYYLTDQFYFSVTRRVLPR